MSENVENLHEVRIERAITRGFIPPEGATEVQIATGLEDMHEAPFEKIGQFLLAEPTDTTSQAS